MTTEDKFQKIAEDTIRTASGVDCSLAEFCDGLQTIIDELKDRKRMVIDELGRD